MTSNDAVPAAAPSPVRSTARHRNLRPAAAVLALLLGGTLLAGCSGSSGASSEADQAAAGEAGGAPAAEAGDDGSVGGAVAADTERQVVKTGEIWLTVDDAAEAAAKVAQVVDRFDGRIDAQELVATSEDEPGWATMTLRIPNDDLADAVAALHDVGEVTHYTDSTMDVTVAARDLDARITAAEMSVERMQALLDKASSTTDLIASEQALSDREATLESLRSERDALADQISYSTLNVSLSTPGELVHTVTEQKSFLDGLKGGWSALWTTLRVVALVLGYLLPWLVAAAIVTAAVVGIVRLVRRYRPARPPRPQPVPAGMYAPRAAAYPVPGAPQPYPAPHPMPQAPPAAPTTPPAPSDPS